MTLVILGCSAANQSRLKHLTDAERVQQSPSNSLAVGKRDEDQWTRTANQLDPQESINLGVWWGYGGVITAAKWVSFGINKQHFCAGQAIFSACTLYCTAIALLRLSLQTPLRRPFARNILTLAQIVRPTRILFHTVRQFPSCRHFQPTNNREQPRPD